MLDNSDDKLRRTAFHEAGHAWMMWKEGLGVRSVSIEPHAPAPGDVRLRFVLFRLSRRYRPAALLRGAASVR